ncbi:MAG: hypothetical protein HC886_20260 [Leptolyngbyaceae cyanobacterium SM1_1_3]|nr:hypothetical protein [Leptolyngbyaceae cyanobacterium SM1_1_3]NJN03978.1 hypothetical protein [Leptolyngbyaceae cyanobacterium RM1_1_2]NJO08706.1 hypothetical protein [Leptolyngbyaceae cyanobacterium SL_1_1]
MITLTPDEVTLIRTIFDVLRGIKVRDIDRALLILSKFDRAQKAVFPPTKSATEPKKEA